MYYAEEKSMETYASFILQKDEMEMYNAVGTVGPVSIAYDVSSDFRFYKHGVYSRYVYVFGRISHCLLTRS